MSKLKVQKRPLCIFCEKPNKVSAEHLFPRWLKKMFPNQDGARWIKAEWMLPDGRRDNTPLNPKAKEKQGSALDFTLRGPCHVCNTGWMSRIEDECKPLLQVLMHGDATTVSVADQRKLSEWAALKTMVYDGADGERGYTIPSAERKIFFEKRVIPPSWKIRIAQSANPQFGNCTLNKCFVGKRNPQDKASNTVVTQLILGDLTVVVIASEAAWVQELFLPLHLRLIVRQIHPSEGFPFNWPLPRRLTPRESEALVNWSRNVRFADEFVK